MSLEQINRLEDISPMTRNRLSSLVKLSHNQVTDSFFGHGTQQSIGDEILMQFLESQEDEIRNSIRLSNILK